MKKLLRGFQVPILVDERVPQNSLSVRSFRRIFSQNEGDEAS